MPFVDVKKARLYYEMDGNGRCVLLIHGAWVSHEWWKWQVPALSRYYKVINFDIRGHGQSSLLKEPASINVFAEDVDELLKRLEVDEIAIVGWSMGGFVAIQYCIDFPSRVKTLILIATRGHCNLHERLRLLIQYIIGRMSLAMDFSSPRSYDRIARRFPTEEGWFQREIQRMLSPSAPKEVYEWIMTYTKNNPHGDFLNVAKSFWDWEAGEKLKGINIPTLIMAGEKDRCIPTRFSYMLNTMIPDSRLKIFKDAGHCLPLEQYELVNEEIIRFLKDIGY
jgi:pimeloyl-ACP methyl ester carboxylesterase